jgi:hypothetical protein
LLYQRHCLTILVDAWTENHRLDFVQMLAY